MNLAIGKVSLNYSLVDNAKLYPKKFIKKISFYHSMIKSDFDCILSLDGKKRSIFACVISNANLNYHIESMYDGKKPSECYILDAEHTQKSGLNDHFSSILEEKNCC